MLDVIYRAEFVTNLACCYVVCIRVLSDNEKPSQVPRKIQIGFNRSISVSSFKSKYPRGFKIGRCFTRLMPSSPSYSSFLDFYFIFSLSAC